MRYALILIPICCMQSVAGGQTPPGPQSKAEKIPDNRITVDVSRVNMLLTVTDKKGRFITALTRDDFEVFEQKKQQSILSFTSESDLPLRIAVLIDTSNSVRDRFRFQQEAAVQFINSVMRPENKAAVISFDTGPELVTDLTNDVSQLANGIRDLRPGGGTSVYDAIYLASRELLVRDQPLHDYRRALIILSDGEDNQSRQSRDQALEAAMRSDVTIFCISTNISGQESQGDKVLKYFAEETGGATFFPFKATDLSRSFENIASELRHQYSILYRPDAAKADGQFHAVTIRVKGRKDLLIRARRGYYAPKP